MIRVLETNQRDIQGVVRISAVQVEHLRVDLSDPPALSLMCTVERSNLSSSVSSPRRRKITTGPRKIHFELQVPVALHDLPQALSAHLHT